MNKKDHPRSLVVASPNPTAVILVPTAFKSLLKVERAYSMLASFRLTPSTSGLGVKTIHTKVDQMRMFANTASNSLSNSQPLHELYQMDQGVAHFLE